MQYYIIQVVFLCILDIDECSSQPGICVNGECINSQGSFRCQCPHGFTLGPDRRTCLGKYIYLSVHEEDTLFSASVPLKTALFSDYTFDTLMTTYEKQQI